MKTLVLKGEMVEGYFSEFVKNIESFGEEEIQIFFSSNGGHFEEMEGTREYILLKPNIKKIIFFDFLGSSGFELFLDLAERFEGEIKLVGDVYACIHLSSIPMRTSDFAVQYGVFTLNRGRELDERMIKRWEKYGVKPFQIQKVREGENFCLSTEEVKEIYRKIIDNKNKIV